MENQVEHLEKMGVVRQSNSPWNASVVLVKKKKNQTVRGFKTVEFCKNKIWDDNGKNAFVTIKNVLFKPP